ncbi:transcription termination factor 3, mitochondrial [Achroia grisella]|uniref:transcription termination factor 3, mitochondrial n=1 Tax=Achroia grisella TaxID=688607 RepID=UPI0027D2BB0F|nr:transcription termination factor 3, mitochondrial [Achroia grisella]XP_059048903.1 transcription termination factor 3, mitochondrial [Achroia grisella]
MVPRSVFSRTILNNITWLNGKKYLSSIPCCANAVSDTYIKTDSSEINVIKSTNEDLSDVNPHLPKTFNLAAYVNKSRILQNLLFLNVNLSKIEKKPHIAEKLMKLDFDDIKDHILFLKDYVDADNIGIFFTINPMILYQSLDDLKVRIHYLQSKCFTHDQIQQIISKNPFWLMFSTIRIDRRLGFYQNKFNLVGDEIRLLATKRPKIITYNLHHINTNTFVIKEEMGFEDHEMKQLILQKPKLWMLNQKVLLERFHYIHNIMNIPHETILKSPGVILCRNFKLKQRHLFLEKLGRAQYNPNKENYVPIIALAEGTDLEFCNKYAKTNISDFNIFLKTL